MSAPISVPERRTVLVVDGEEHELDSVEATLSARGYDVLRARDGQEALEAVRAWYPDLVLTEVPLPRLDGYELCRELQRDAAAREIPVIFHSATHAHPAGEAHALANGARRFLAKPSDPDVLAQAVAEALDRRQEPPAGGSADELRSLQRQNRRLSAQLEQRSQQLDETGRRLRRELELRREAQERVYRLAYFDGVTGLPNRAQLLERLEAAAQARGGAGCALLLLDLDDFRRVHCTLGRSRADALLRLVAARLSRTAARGSHFLAHLGGDEFALVLDDGADPGRAGALAHRLVEDLAGAFDLDGLALDLTASVGIALGPGQERDAAALLRQAETALQHAKATPGAVAFYTREHDPHEPQRLKLVGSLRQALHAGELVLFYQPKVHVSRGVAVEAEALVRWAHPQLGLLEPGAFLGLAEQTGQTRALTRALLDAVAHQGAAWRAAGLDLRISLNLCARGLLDAELPQAVCAAATAAGIEAAGLAVEVTESALLQEPERARAVLERLAAEGVRVAIDDFGTGYSSLAYLKHLPVSELKIDRSFVLGMMKDADDEVIVRSTIELAHNLGLEATAEGVESAAAWERVQALGCDLAQGFLLGRPMPAPELEAWMRDSRWGHAAAAAPGSASDPPSR
jgi:diguanylate cyclase (GGDEF)-like protein